MFASISKTIRPFRTSKSERALLRRNSLVNVNEDPEKAEAIRRQSVLNALVDNNVTYDDATGECDSDSVNSCPGDYEKTNKRQEEKKKKSYVTFDCVRVHTHAFELGDNPSTQKGVPLTIGWDVVDSEELSLEKYERRKNRYWVKKKLVRIPAKQRMAIVKRKGHSRESITRVTEECEGWKQSRAETQYELLKQSRAISSSSRQDLRNSLNKIA